MQLWKLPHIVKGMLTWIPPLNAFRRRATGGTDSARYCYSVWMRHLVALQPYNFNIEGANVGELGPGDSIAIGLAALITGARAYTGLDIVPFSATANLPMMLDDLTKMFINREPIPDSREFPRVWPQLESYEFPKFLNHSANVIETSNRIRNELANAQTSRLIDYCAPWSSPAVVAPGTLDLIFSQAVLEHVDHLPETYEAMFAWLRPGGHASHVIDFSAHYLSPFWNGHWAYTQSEWQLARGRREFLLNRKPLSSHIACLKKSGFQIMSLIHERDTSGLQPEALAPEFRDFAAEDAQTRGCFFILKKPE